MSLIGFFFLRFFILDIEVLANIDALTNVPACVLAPYEDLNLSSLSLQMALLISLEEPFLEFLDDFLILSNMKRARWKRGECDLASNETSLILRVWDKANSYLFIVHRWTQEREIFLVFNQISLGLTAIDSLICSVIRISLDQLENRRVVKNHSSQFTTTILLVFFARLIMFFYSVASLSKNQF